MRDFYQEIIDIIGAGGEACCVIPIGDPEFENAAHETVTTKGQGGLDGLVFTYSEARTDWALVTEYIRNQFRTPNVRFDGVTDEADTPDADVWSRDDGSSEGLSIGGLVFVNPAFVGGQTILSKWESTGNLREWALRFDGATLDLVFEKRDESESVNVKRETDANFSLGEVLSVIVTDDGSGGASAADGIAIYLRGLVEASTATNNASYVAMEADTHVVELARIDSVAGLWDGLLGTLFFTHRVLSAVEAFNLNDIYVDMQRAQRSPLLVGVF